jgi:hypothetical protein
MDITVAVDDETLERARETARRQGTCLNALIREYIECLAKQGTGEAVLAEFQELWADVDESPDAIQSGSPGRTFDREQIYEERLGRYDDKGG